MPEHMHHFAIHQFAPMPWFWFDPSFAQLFALLFTLFWIWTLVDCIRNSRLSGASKTIWFLFILFTHWIGAVCYFLFGRARSSQNKIHYWQNYQRYSQAYRPPQTYYQPSRQAPANRQTKQASAQEYAEYREGYQAQERAAFQEGAQERERATTHDWQHYEEPQATYQEMPPQQE